MYKAEANLMNDKDFVKIINGLKNYGKNFCIDLTLDVFTQMWGSTATGFDDTIGDRAMTEEYTVVVHERTTDWYLVFFGENPGYIVVGANERFLQDLKNHSIASCSEARTRYKED